jgi:steroid 5-alpha reductase family enzyme
MNNRLLELCLVIALVLMLGFYVWFCVALLSEDVTFIDIFFCLLPPVVFAFLWFKDKKE